MQPKPNARKLALALSAIVLALLVQVLPIDAVTPAAYARCPLKGVVEPAMAGGGYWAYVHDGDGNAIAIVVTEEGNPHRFRNREAAQRAADQLAGFLCTKLYGEPPMPGNGNPPPYFPLPIPPQV